MVRSVLMVSLLSIVYVLSIGAPALQAQSYPSYPIQLVIPGNPGDGADIAARMFAEEFAKILGLLVVARHQRHDQKLCERNGQRLAQGRVDLSVHDRRARLVLRRRGGCGHCA